MADDPPLAAPAVAPGMLTGVAERPTLTRGAGLVLALVVLVAAVLLSLGVGSNGIPPADVWHELTHRTGSAEGEIIRELRVPRTVLGLEVGIALGVGGALMQALTRNPLADPGLLGVNAGAAAAMVIAMAALGLTRLTEYVWFAFVGAALVSLLVYGLGARGGGGASPVRLALAGTAVTAALSAFVAAMVILQPQTFEQFRYWEVGALSGRGSAVVTQIAAFVGVGLVVALGLGRSLNALALGEETGRSLGISPGRTRALGAFAIVLLCGSATAAVGPIAFVGLVVPHMVRAITGPDQRWILPYCVLLSPALLLGADVVGRVLNRPGEIPVAVVTAFVGAPVFIALVRRRRIARL